MSRQTTSPVRRGRRAGPRSPMGCLLPMAAVLLVGVLLAAALSPRSEAKTSAGAGASASHLAEQLAGSIPDQSGSSSPPLSPPAQKGKVPGRDPEPASAEEDWMLILVNARNLLPEDWSVTLVELKNNMAVDQRCYPDLQAMMDACRAAGLSPLICSSYRTQTYQEQLFERQVAQLTIQGNAQNAAGEAGTMVAIPGASEHQTGLAVDIVDQNNQNLDESQADTPVQQWLMAHSWEYGFILRYPPEKSEITGIIYEPWHYRYVGREAARQIHSLGICLEEYLAQA